MPEHGSKTPLGEAGMEWKNLRVDHHVMKPDFHFQRCHPLWPLLLFLALCTTGKDRAEAGSTLTLWDAHTHFEETISAENRTGWKAVPSELFVLESDPAKASSDPGYYGREYSFTGDAIVENHSLAAVFYASINHRFTSRLGGAVYLSYQNTTYNGGSYDGDRTGYLTIDSRLDYKLREYLFLDLGYVWYNYTSTFPNSAFMRNRVYFGIRATY